jgi:cytochrome c nitrite reductase small subunit
MSRKLIIVIVVLLAAVVLGGVGAVGFWQYHEKPEFCATCHIMDPYLESWQDSDLGAHAHAVEDITCLDCHEPTVQQQVQELVVYMQGDFDVPLAQIRYPMSECLECHDSYAALAELTSGGDFNPHGSHWGELECGVCHGMHKESVDYCDQCHQTNMQVP